MSHLFTDNLLNHRIIVQGNSSLSQNNQLDYSVSLLVKQIWCGGAIVHTQMKIKRSLEIKSKDQSNLLFFWAVIQSCGSKCIKEEKGFKASRPANNI